ncbi:MAG TPA: GTPase [Planctomycetaceae bacterium]|nr:GTPase [Planctomycetaceae bacterium]
MPANLTPQYQKAEEEYRRAQNPEEQIQCLERMLTLIPKHKGTEKLQADLKTRLKETRGAAELEAKSPKKVGKSYRYPRQGAGQVVLLGGPNAGKSRILAELTKATPEVAPYPFTTREPLPGMMAWEDVAVQLIDTPPITDSHFEPYLTSIVRSVDLTLLAFDGSSDDAPDQTMDVVRQLASRKTVLASQSGFADEDFSTVKVQTRLVATRADDSGCDDRLAYLKEGMPHDFPLLKVEFDQPESREALRRAVYDALGLIRIYTKRPGRPAELDSPFTIPLGGTVDDLAVRVHRDMAEQLKFAKVWGTSARDGQSVGRDHALADKDVVELHW